MSRSVSHPLRLALGTAISALAVAAADARPANLPDPAGPEDFAPADAEAVALGRNLFFDPILSGNKNIACATCHHPSLGTSDGMSLSIGEGGYGLGPDRALSGQGQIHARIPRNAPALWNKGALEFSVMFHDGRLAIDADAPGGVKMPEGSALERTLDSALAAQATLPITSADEMAGHENENPVGDAIAAKMIGGDGGAWELLAARLEEIPEYRTAFDWQIGKGEPIHITDVATALAAFMRFEFRATDSPFDRYLRGDDGALTEAQIRGMELFYGDAGCAACHAGTFQTDHDFHALGMPQFGPGKGPEHAEYADLGLGAVTGDPVDNYKFRTPSLRNITLTPPYGHNGAYATLEATIRHHLNPADSLRSYDRSQARLHGVETDYADFEALEDPAEIDRIAAAIEIDLPPRSDAEIADLVAFLGALEDPVAETGRLGAPETLPSGLPLDPLPDQADPMLAAARPPRQNPRRRAPLPPRRRPPRPRRSSPYRRPRRPASRSTRRTTSASTRCRSAASRGPASGSAPVRATATAWWRALGNRTNVEVLSRSRRTAGSGCAR